MVGNYLDGKFLWLETPPPFKTGYWLSDAIYVKQDDVILKQSLSNSAISFSWNLICCRWSLH